MTRNLLDTVSWAAHRRAVVHTVKRRVPSVDPEVAASRGLSALCARIVADGRVERPADIWCDAAVRAAQDMLRAVPPAAPRLGRADDEMPGADAHLRSAHVRERV